MRDFTSSMPQDFAGRAREIFDSVRGIDPEVAAEILALELRKAHTSGQMDGLRDGSKVTDRLLDRLRPADKQEAANA